ncbi:MAG TPA: hypothetical protein VFB60_25970 [Ktedonobacteraceae bacterium]|nr:hypothetical protein [Ktedonobacteraceae bacterium]
MTQFPDIEARLIAQEHTTAMLYARIEELSRDMVASFDHLAKYQIATENQLDVRFNAVDARFDKVDARFDKVEASIASLEQRFTSLENKTDQRFAALDNKLEQRFASLDNKFDSMLQLLTVLTKKIVE